MHITKKIDFILIGISAVILLGLVGYAQPLVISPINGLVTDNSSVLFSFGKADTIMIDDNEDFTSPLLIRAEDNLVVTLEPGKYYWYIEGVRESEVHTLTIMSKVDLRLKPSGEDYEVVNAGNVRLDVSVYNGTELKEEKTLDKGSSFNSSGSLFVGGQSEN